MMKKSGIMKRLTGMLLAAGIMLTMAGPQAMASPADKVHQERAARIAKATNTEEVKTISWKARLKTAVKVKTVATDGFPSEEVALKQGKKITVIQRDYHEKRGVSECQLKDGRTCYIANQFLLFYKALATGAKGDYDQATKEAFVNGVNGVDGISALAGTDKLIWISLDKQRVNIFQGRRGSWKLIRECVCSTGAPDSPTFDQTFKKVFKVQKKSPSVSYGEVTGLKYYTFIYGYGMHLWTGPGRKQMGKKPLSHSCVRLKKKDAVWIYDDENIPVGTRIYVW